jgi:hypothetical protein
LDFRQDLQRQAEMLAGVSCFEETRSRRLVSSGRQ